ncbi:hypothetical protein QSH57_004385 [Fusarium oxysporum f. sp. vasinfectum]|nr:hypothetical protein QSH57_004385 [Fusarium oxysporum f. sp. vasinfectum]
MPCPQQYPPPQTVQSWTKVLADVKDQSGDHVVATETSANSSDLITNTAFMFLGAADIAPIKRDPSPTRE